MSSDEQFSLRLSDSDSENQTQQKLIPSPVFGGKKTAKRFNRNPAQVRIKFVKNCTKEVVRNPVCNRKTLVKGWSKNCRQVPISKQQKAAVETTDTIHTSSGKTQNTEVHNKKSANNQLVSPAKREIQLNVSPQCLSKNDDAKRTQGSPQKQLSTQIFESEEHEVIRLERSVKNLPTITNKEYLADNVCKNFADISNVDFQKSTQVNSSSKSSKEYAIFDSTKRSDSSPEFLGFKNQVQSFFPKVADNKRQVLKKTITAGSGKNLSTNRKSVPRNFESAEKKLVLSSSSDTSETSSKRNVRTNNNYVTTNFEYVEKKNKNISEINKSLQRRYPLRSNRIEASYSIEKSSDSSEKSWDSSEKASDSSKKSSDSSEKSLDSSENSSDSNKKSLVSSEELLYSSTKFKKSFHTDKISYSKKYHNENFLSSSSSDTSTECLVSKTTWSQRNLPTNQNNVSSDFEPIRKKKKNIRLNCSSSDSSTEFFGFVQITSTPKNQILKRRRYCEPSSSDESDDSSPNDRNRFIIRSDKKYKRRKLIRKSSSSDSEDISFTNPSKSSSRFKSESSSTDDNYSRSVNTAKRDIKDSRKRKEEKIKKLRNYFINVNVDLRCQKYFWRDCQLNVDKVLKWIKNQKNINNLIENPRALQREIEVYLEHLELNTRSIISLNKRVTRSQTAAQRWQHFLKYGKTVKR